MCGTSAGAKYNMLNRLQAASRLLIRASLALFTGVVLLLIQSAFWSNRVSSWMQLVLFAMALLSYFRPHYGLLARRGTCAAGPGRQPHARLIDARRRSARARISRRRAGARVDAARVPHVSIHTPPCRRCSSLDSSSRRRVSSSSGGSRSTAISPGHMCRSC